MQQLDKGEPNKRTGRLIAVGNAQPRHRSTCACGWRSRKSLGSQGVGQVSLPAWLRRVGKPAFDFSVNRRNVVWNFHLQF